ncbi:MAG: DUF433 domain-containing protein [Spirulinaceae cyanobacterium]
MLKNRHNINIPILHEDETGVIRVAGTRVLLELVIRAFQDSATPEQIVQRYASLTLADVYLIIGYYLQNQSEIHAYLEAREQRAATVRQKLSTVQPNLDSIRTRLLAQQGN